MAECARTGPVPARGLGSLLALIVASALCAFWQWCGAWWRSRGHLDAQWAWPRLAALWLGVAAVSTRWTLALRRADRPRGLQVEESGERGVELRASAQAGVGMSHASRGRMLEQIRSACGPRKGRPATCKRASHPALLPARPCHSASPKPLTVVLDLDHTLLACYPAASAPPEVLFAVDSGKLRGARFSTRDGEPVVLAARPGVEEFLTRVSAFAEVVLFTAGEEAYAKPLVQWLDPGGRMFSACLFRESTVRTRYHENVKDLWALGRDLSKTVLVDDKPLAGSLQPFNLLPCPPFLGDPFDRGLLKTVLPCLEVLRGVEDVRPALRSGFRVDGYLKSCRIPGEYLRQVAANKGCTCHYRMKPVSHEYLELMS
ncbi:unnamed protein product [Ostreobium quekettii]|uniref:Mitochondrial import inner membrane translocase subunit TIM50 n=1 Tax=Ostreobium quekettii TaxID=121088 RepID=A0A8S1IRF4_9CHLO|nr:unnamed protein product [Ostreobium quekettii]